MQTIFSRPLLRAVLSSTRPHLHPYRPSLVPSIPVLTRPKTTLGQTLRGSRIPPKRKRIKKSESPDLNHNPFKKAVVQKVYITKPKVSFCIVVCLTLET